MAAAAYRYRPDYAVLPGSLLKEYLALKVLSTAELARTAAKFEHVLGMDARIWFGIEADYRLHRRRTAEAEDRDTKA